MKCLAYMDKMLRHIYHTYNTEIVGHLVNSAIVLLETMTQHLLINIRSYLAI